MKTLEKNVINANGERGSEWLRSLPHVIEKLSQHWQLSEIQPANNMSWNYVAFALQDDSRHVVLKISCDKKLIQNEYRALKHFDGIGAIKVIDICDEYNAMLLEQAIPGLVLKEQYAGDIEYTIKIYSEVVRKIASHRLIDTTYEHVLEWCNAIDKINDKRINSEYVGKAKQLKSELLGSAVDEYLCHGDLHLENVIQDGSQWLAIDPKGIVGEMAFEAAAFDLLGEDEINTATTTKIVDRVRQISATLGIDYNRLISWIFIRVMISAQWFVEDKGDPSRMLILADYLFPLIKNVDHCK